MIKLLKGQFLFGRYLALLTAKGICGMVRHGRLIRGEDRPMNNDKRRLRHGPAKAGLWHIWATIGGACAEKLDEPHAPISSTKKASERINHHEQN